MHFYAALASPLWGGYQLSLCRTANQLASSALAILGTVSMMGASGSYHTVHWKDEKQEAFLASLDYCGIFMQVAFSLTPAYVLLLPGLVGWSVVAALGMTAAAGIGLVFSGVRVGRHGLTTLYITQAALNLAPLATNIFASQTVLEQLTVVELRLLVIAAIAYLVGSQIYAYAAPKLWPRSFGFHELWHLLVTVASFCTYRTNCSVIQRLAS